MSQLVVADVLVRTDTEGRFCLNDLHKAAGGEQKHRPKYWIFNKATDELIAELAEGEIPPYKTERGRYGGTYVCRELVYSYAMWISPAYNLALELKQNGLNSPIKSERGHYCLNDLHKAAGGERKA